MKFPRARLLVYERLVKGGESCVQAIVNVAVELGVVKSGVLDDLHLSANTASCGSEFAAKRVLELALEQRGYHKSQEHVQLDERIWNSIEKQITNYKSRIVPMHECTAGSSLKWHDCAQTAPVVLDILLQHLTPYL